MIGRCKHRVVYQLLWRLLLLWTVVVQAAHINTAAQQQQAQHLYESGIHSRDVGNIAGAISALHKAILLYQTSQPDADALAEALYQLAETYTLSDASGNSEPYYRQALELYAQLENPSAKLRWATCLNRLGVLMVERYNAQQPEKVQELLQGGFHGDWNDEEVLQKVMNQMDTSIPKQAVQYFQDAAQVFRASGSAREIQQALATSLQNMALATTQLGHVQKAIKALEESILIYENLLKQEVDQEAAQGMAEAFYSMADLYLQEGAYEMAKDRYRRSMDCFENFGLPSLKTDDGLGDFDWSEQLTELEDALEEYMNLDADDVSMYGEDADYFGGDYSAHDPGYEGDLHTNLGSLYLAQGDMVLAASHLQQAVRKYEMLGEANTHNMATAKFNLALLYFKGGDFPKSAISYAEAIDIFRLVGTEFGPIQLEDIEDKLQEALHSQIQPMGIDDDLEEAVEGQRSIPESEESVGVPDAKDPQPTFGKDAATGLFVDMEHFRAQNANHSISDEL